MLCKTGRLSPAEWISLLVKQYRNIHFPIRLIQRHYPSSIQKIHTRPGGACVEEAFALDSHVLLDARQVANSPRASGLDDRHAWRASPLFHQAALYAGLPENSPAVERQLELSPTTAAVHSLARVGALRILGMAICHLCRFDWWCFDVH